MKLHVKSIYHSLVLGILISLFLIYSPALAVFTWDGDQADNFWTTDLNWSGGTAPAGALGDSLAFDASDVGDRTVTSADGAYTTISGIDFSGALGAFSIAGAGSFSLDAGATITGNGGLTHNFNTIDFVSNGAGFTFGGTDSYTVGGVISGTTLISSTTGTLTLTGTNTYSTGTTLNANSTIILGADAALGTGGLTLGGAGALQSNNDARSVSNAIANGGFGLTVSGASNLELSGIMSGAGTLTVGMTAGVDTLTLSGNNTYAGGTTLNTGTIILGHDSALGSGGLTLGGDGTIQSDNDARSVSNAIANGGNGLTVSGASNLELSGIMSGAGTLTVGMTAGADTLTLSGNNTYAGGTTLNTGTIILGHDSALGSGGLTLGGAGALQSNNDARVVSNTIATGGNALTVSGASNLELSGIISGAGGTLTKSGAGTLTLSAVNTYDGLTNITAGTLTGAFTVAGNLTVSNGGTLAPGSSIGTTTIGGDYLLDAGGTLEVEVENDGALQSDLVDVTGSATLAAGSTINVTDISSGGNIINTGDTFTIIQTGTGVTDNGPTITDTSAVLSFAGSVSGNDYQLAATRASFASSVSMGTGIPALTAIDSDLSSATGDYTTLINALTALNSTQLRDAGEQLDPLPHASVTSVSTRTTHRMAGNLANYLSARRSGIERLTTLNTQSRERQLLIADASSDPRMLAQVIKKNRRIAKRQQDEMDSQIKGFFRPFGVFYDHDSTSKMTGFRAKAVGAQFGLDKSFGPDLVAGIGGGYTHSFINYKQGRGEGDVDSFRVGPYATYYKDNFFIDASVSYGSHENENERDIKFGAINRTAKSDYHAWDLSGYIGGGYDFPVKDWIVTPTTSLQYIRYRNEGFNETGAGAAGLDVDATTSQSLRGKVGVTLSTITELYKTKIVPELFVGFAHEFIDDEDISARFVRGTAKFTTDVDDEWDNSVYYGAGISALLKENISAFVRYEGEYSSGNDIKALHVGLTLRF
jgi:outer membrane autotransporter protein